MEWVETTGKTLDDAKASALEQLGVDETDAEFEVVTEPKVGLFGRVRSEARVRARVKPTTPRAKDERRGRRSGNRNNGTTSAKSQSSPRVVKEATSDATGESRPRTRNKPTGQTASDSSEGASAKSSTNGSRSRNRKPAGNKTDAKNGEAQVEVPLEEQISAAEDFLSGLLNKMDFSATLETKKLDDEVAEIQIQGSELGLLIGPKGATLAAIQELTRAAVQRKTEAYRAQIRVDVGGYRVRRDEALARFAAQVAEQVKESGVARSLEPMISSDRRVVHDSISSVVGVHTVSEGEDRLRRVVVLPGETPSS